MELWSPMMALGQQEQRVGQPWNINLVDNVLDFSWFAGINVTVYVVSAAGKPCIVKLWGQTYFACNNQVLPRLSSLDLRLRFLKCGFSEMVLARVLSVNWDSIRWSHVLEAASNENQCYHTHFCRDPHFTLLTRYHDNVCTKLHHVNIWGC